MNLLTSFILRLVQYFDSLLHAMPALLRDKKSHQKRRRLLQLHSFYALPTQQGDALNICLALLFPYFSTYFLCDSQDSNAHEFSMLCCCSLFYYLTLRHKIYIYMSHLKIFQICLNKRVKNIPLKDPFLSMSLLTTRPSPTARTRMRVL